MATGLLSLEKSLSGHNELTPEDTRCLGILSSTSLRVLGFWTAG